VYNNQSHLNSIPILILNLPPTTPHISISSLTSTPHNHSTWPSVSTQHTPRQPLESVAVPSHRPARCTLGAASLPAHLLRIRGESWLTPDPACSDIIKIVFAVILPVSLVLGLHASLSLTLLASRCLPRARMWRTCLFIFQPAKEEALATRSYKLIPRAGRLADQHPPDECVLSLVLALCSAHRGLPIRVSSPSPPRDARSAPCGLERASEHR
jgi:hypothetical protein